MSNELIQVGRILHTADGGLYRCTAKIASSEGVTLRLANLQGQPVPTPDNLRPISPTLARFASWMRWVVAYNRDFDLYVKAYIEAAGLPIDPAMNWSRFFAARVAPKLMSKDSEVQDEAIHHLIITSLVERNVLSNFHTAIKRFPPHIQELPLGKQVTSFLMQTFNWRINEANRYIKDFIFQNETSSMWAEGNDEEGDINRLDIAESEGRPPAYDAVDSDLDIHTFRTGFEKYLSKKFRNETVLQYISLFDLLYSHLREGDLPRGVDLWEEWRTGVGEGKSAAWFKVLFANLPKLIDTYVNSELNGKEVNTFIEVMQNIGRGRKKLEKPLTPVHASLGGLKLAEEFPINHEIESPSSGSSDSGSSDSGSGGGGMSLPDLAAPAGEAGEAAAGAGEALEALAPLALAAASKRGGSQWEVPKCKSCGSSKAPADCSACKEKFCGDCMLNHHANNPSHDRVASKTAWYGHTIRMEQQQTDAAIRTGEALKQHCEKAHIGPFQGKIDPNCRACADIQKKMERLKTSAMDSEDYAFHEMDTALDIKHIIEDVIGSGLYEAVGEHYFSWAGCDYCDSEGADVTDYKGYRNLEDAQAPNREEKEYDFKLCDDCHNKLYYGDVT